MKINLKDGCTINLVGCFFYILLVLGLAALVGTGVSIKFPGGLGLGVVLGAIIGIPRMIWIFK